MRNGSEAQFIRKAALEGWVVTKRGWPDFICRRGLEVIAVEVKESDWLSPEQDATLRDLYSVGLKTFVWTLGGGFKPYPTDRLDSIPSRLELLRELDALNKQLEKRDDTISELQQKLKLANRARRYEHDLLRGKKAHVRLDDLAEVAAAVDNGE